PRAEGPGNLSRRQPGRAHHHHAAEPAEAGCAATEQGRESAACRGANAPRRAAACRGPASRAGADTPPRDRSDPFMTTLRAAGLEKSYKSRQVVSNLSLEVSNGEVVGLL